jgi:Holliday junction resolvasome RuvABC endonuclease subunit
VLGKGGGGGDKQQMITAIKALFPELQVPSVKLSEHEADAIAMAILALRVDLVGDIQ